MRPGSARQPWLVFAAWAALLLALVQPTVRAYAPVSDEWALLQHSHFGWAALREWFSSGFADYFSTRPGVDTPPMHFIRPVFNGIYALLALLLGTGSGAYLYLAMLAAAACAGLLCAAAARGGAGRGYALAAGAVLPLLPGYAGSVSLFFVPCFMFDIIAAALCLAAYLLYLRQRYLTAAALLVVALLTKETALPVAIAFALHRLLLAWPQPVAQRWRAVLPFVLAPALWAGLRLAAFGEIGGGTYVYDGSAASALRNFVLHLRDYPYYANYPATGAAATLLKLINTCCCALVGLLLAWRAWRRRTLELAELVVLVSLPFLLAVANASRFGASFDAFLLLAGLHWLADAQLPYRLPAVLGLLLAAGAVLYGIHVSRAYTIYRDDYLRMYRVSQRYTAALAALPGDAHVIVLNDPVSRYSPASAVRAVAGIGAQVDKITDFPWNTQWFTHEPGCRAQFEALPGGARLAQSCGLELSGAIVSRQQALDLHWPGLARAQLRHDAALVGSEGWNRLEVRLDEAVRGRSWWMYFDPVRDEFVAVPAT